MDFQSLSALENKAAEPMPERPKPRGRKRAVLTVADEHEREERRLAKRRCRYGSNTYVCECEQTVKMDNKQHKRSQKHIRAMEQKRRTAPPRPRTQDIIEELRREEQSEASRGENARSFLSARHLASRLHPCRRQHGLRDLPAPEYEPKMRDATALCVDDGDESELPVDELRHRDELLHRAVLFLDGDHQVKALLNLLAHAQRGVFKGQSESTQDPAQTKGL